MIPITKPWLGQEERQAVASVLDSGWLMQGARVAEFEQVVAKACSAAHAVACSSGTTALHLALMALGIGPGDQVIVPSYTFIATANAVVHCGATPVFADIDPDTFNLDPKAVEGVITARTKAIMPVHQFGFPADLDGFAELARRFSIHLVEDAACAIGSVFKGRPIGSGHLVCFSFHPRKVITTGEGGMVLTGDAQLAERMRELRQHGQSGQGRYSRVGYNYRLTDLQAAIGLSQMQRLNGILSRRHVIGQCYNEAFSKFSSLRLPKVAPASQPNFQSYVLSLASSAQLSRDQLVEQLVASGIGAKPGIFPIHREVPYIRHASANLPGTQLASDSSFLLPLYPTMTEGEQARVVQAVSHLL